jgi:hypothetical protein
VSSGFEAWPDRWKQRTVICIASGPSLAAEDCETARASGHPVIVTNTTFRLCPWADVLMAFDGKWWKEYHAEVSATFNGAKFACSKPATAYGIPNIGAEKWFKSFNNSGAAAIAFAVVAGASRIVLLGFDCQKTGGRTHHHGDHPAHLSNAESIANWPTHFKNVARFCSERRAEVINASRATALRCFRRAPLPEALALEVKS